MKSERKDGELIKVRAESSEVDLLQIISGAHERCGSTKLTAITDTCFRETSTVRLDWLKISAVSRTL